MRPSLKWGLIGLLPAVAPARADDPDCDPSKRGGPAMRLTTMLVFVLGLLVISSSAAAICCGNPNCNFPGPSCQDAGDALSCPNGFRPCADSLMCDGDDNCIFIAASTCAAECDDGNPCTDDTCDSAGGGFVCSHTPNTGAACDDGNRCTKDTCRDGSCVGIPDLSTCHFQCYEVKPAAFAGPTVNLHDEFGSVGGALVQRPERLCAPADKNGEDPAAPTEPEHLEGYKIRAAFPRALGLMVVDQFGSLFLDVTAIDRLFVPTAKSLTAPPPPLADPTTDHFDCYKVRKTKGTASFAPRTVTVEDQFGTVTVSLKRPFRLCAPVDKNGEAPGAETHPVHLLCYKAASTAFPTLTPFTNNQFGPGTPILIHRRELCVPAVTPDCYDGAQDGQETGTDCGGPTCQPCPLALGCFVNSDCSSGYCANGFCQPPPTCSDAVLDGDETGIDCGGRFCFRCDPGASCNDPSDCTSDVCSGNVCESPTCVDGVLNGDESDVDCGGSICVPCPSGGSCNTDSDCQSNNCGADGFCEAGSTTTTTTPGGSTTTTTTLPACDCNTCMTLRTNGGTLPNPTKCKKGATAEADCHGWEPAGTLDDKDDLSGAGANRASHFVKEFETACGTFTCSYLPRWDVATVTPPHPNPSKKMLHGLLCFSKSGCDTCAYDRQEDDDRTMDRPFTDLALQEDTKATNTVPCGACHRPGPVLPKKDLWDDAAPKLKSRNWECTGNGGPKWLCIEGEPDFPKPNTAEIVPNDITNGVKKVCADCHSEGFIRKGQNPGYCNIIKTAFEPGGSMEGKGVKDADKWSKDDCEKWMKAMKCDPKDFCTKKEVAVQ